MFLPNVAVGDPHVDAHNEERGVLNLVNSQVNSLMKQVLSSVNASEAYIGVAPLEATESDEVWRITKISLTQQVDTIAVGAWVDRETLIYS